MAEQDDNPSPSTGGSAAGEPGRQDASGDRRGASDSPSASGSERERSIAAGVLRYVAIIIGSIIGGALVLLLVFVLALQTNWGGTHFADFLVAVANPFSEAITEYDELRGNFVTRIELRDLRMYRLDSVYVDTIHTDPRTIRFARKDSITSAAELAVFDTMYVDTLLLAAIDTFRIRYNLLALLRKEVHMREITFDRPVLSARQRPNSTWDLLEPFAREDTAAAGEAAFSFRIDALHITDGELFAVYDPPGADSVLRAENLNVRARDVRIAETIDARLDTLFASYSPPGLDDWTQLRAGGTILDDELDLAGLEIESARSFVTASGQLRLPSEEDEGLQDIDFELHADPVSFRDLHPFVPALNPDREATVDLQAGGSGRLLEVGASASLSDGASATLSGSVSPATKGPLEYRAEGRLERFDPLFFTGTGEPAALINADFDVDLSGTDLQNLGGTTSATFRQSTLGGMDLNAARLAASFTDGRADLEMTSTLNGSTVSAEGFVRPFDQTPAYELSGRTRAFDLASLGMELQHSDLNATFAVDGYGFDPSTAEADVQIQLLSSSINEVALNSGLFELDLGGGQLSYGVRILFPDGLIAANGNADLRDPVAFTVDRGRFENVDLAALLGQDVQSALSGQFSLDGDGADPREMTLTADLEMEPSTYGTVQLQEGRAGARLEAGALTLTASAGLEDAGSFDFAAETRPFDDLPIVRVTRGEFTNVDGGALTQSEDHSSDLSGTAAFTLRGFEPASMRLEGSLALAPSRINEQEIQSASVEIGLEDGTLAFDGAVDLPEGSAVLAGTARPFLDVPTYDATQGTFSNINVGAFTGDAELESSLNGTISARGAGFDPETMSVQGRLDLADSRINEQQIEAAFVEGRLEEGTFELDVSLQVPEGTTRLAGTVRPFLENPTFTVTQGDFAGIDVAALTGNPSLRTNLSGEITLTGRGFEPESMFVEGAIRFDSSRVNDVVLSGGSLSGSVEGGFTEFEVDLDFLDGSARAEGRGTFFADVPEYALEGTLLNVQLGDLAGNDTLAARVSAEFGLEGTGIDPRTMELQGRLTSDDAYVEGAEVETLFADVQLSDGLVRVDSLLIASTALDARGSGLIALYDTATVSNFRFAADIRDLAPVRSFVPAENLSLEGGQLLGRIYGQPGTTRFDATGTLSSFIYNDIRLAEFDGTLAGEMRPDSGITMAEVRGTFLSISLPQFLIERADLDVTYTPSSIHFAGTTTIEQGRTAELSGFVDTDLEQQRVVLETLDLTLDDHHWQLLQTAVITYADRYRISNLLLYTDDEQFAIDGVIDPNGQQNLVMTIENVETAPIADLLGFEGLGGVVTGSLVLTGPAEAPVMTGTLNTDVSSYEEEVGDLRLQLDYADLRLNVGALLTHADGSTLNAEGFLPLDLRVARLDEGAAGGDLSQGEVDLRITADSFAVGWIEPFLDPESVDEFDGRLAGEVHLGGTMSQPVLDGSARYSAGRVGIPELGLTYRDIRADFELDQNEVRVQNFVIESGDGSVRGDGTINLSELTLGEFDIDLTADGFRAIESREFVFVVEGDMRLSGTTQEPVLEGGVAVISGEVLLTDETTSPELEQIQLTADDLQTVERRFGMHVTSQDTSSFSLYNALAMDLDVNIERNTWIRSRVNPIMDIQFSGDLDLEKEHYQDVNIFGTIEVVPQRSRIVQFGKRFEITSGTLTFMGPAGDPQIDVEAEYDVRTFGGPDPNVTITLGVEGRMSEQLDLTLGSNPQLEYTDIVSYIATGYPASSTLQLGGSGGQALIGAGQGLALDQLTAIMEGIAEAGLGLDVVTLDQTQGQTSITAGSYVTPRLFLSVSQPITDVAGSNVDQQNRPSVMAEYEITHWLLAQLSQRNQGLRMNLQFEYSY